MFLITLNVTWKGTLKSAGSLKTTLTLRQGASTTNMPPKAKRSRSDSGDPEPPTKTATPSLALSSIFPVRVEVGHHSLFVWHSFFFGGLVDCL
jgi:hypothetical protein